MASGRRSSACVGGVLAVLIVACGGDGPVVVEPTPTHPVSCPLRPGRAEQIDARQLVGMTERNARRVAATHGCQLSVVARDGDEYDVTDDLVPTRISVAVDQGIVIGLRGVG